MASAKAEGKKPEVRLNTVDRYMGALKGLSISEKTLLLQAAGEGKAAHLKPIIPLALATAMRKGEIPGLTWDRVDLEEGMITLAGTDTKNKKVKHVPRNVDALAVLWEQLKLKSKSGTTYVFHRKGQKVGQVKTSWRYAIVRAGLPEGKIS